MLTVLLIALIALVGLVIYGWLMGDWRRQTAVPADDLPDLATPYVEALAAAVRLQQAALEAEQQLYAVAERHLDTDGGPSTARESRP